MQNANGFRSRKKSSPSQHQVALLATGDEICNGDILNSNTQEIAQRLFSNGIQPGIQMVTADNLSEIVTAIHFLLQSHQALIITGGLGPTSDDLTRHALSHALGQKLIFDAATWRAIVERLNYLGYDTPPLSNRQQAFFPAGATIIPNPEGTAAGCMIQQAGKCIFMLPGPPIECLPMVDHFILPTLKNNHFQKILNYQKWLLFGISEAQIAEKLDSLAQPFDCVTGYRFWYPYIEFKLYSNNQADFAHLVPLIEQAITPYLIDNGKQTASDLLKKKLLLLKDKVTICDFATGGLLESMLKTPATYSYVNFSYALKKLTPVLQIKISGLNEFWQQTPNHTKTTLEIFFQWDNKQQENKATIPLRGNRVKLYAVEFICRAIYQFLIEKNL
jgi:nicotinamide-nucleotide amidase